MNLKFFHIEISLTAWPCLQFYYNFAFRSPVSPNIIIAILAFLLSIKSNHYNKIISDKNIITYSSSNIQHYNFTFPKNFNSIYSIIIFYLK